MDHFDDIGPSVVMASPGMMQSGLSRELFESWCTDKRNGVIIAGYCVEGTLAKVGLTAPPPADGTQGSPGCWPMPLHLKTTNIDPYIGRVVW